MKNIALVAHDNKKPNLVEWAVHNKDVLKKYKIYCTGTTGRLIDESLNSISDEYIDIIKLRSGPLGGDQQLGSLISDGEIDLLVFFWDPMTSQPHDVDVKALLRLSVLYNIPTACNRSTADFIITSNLIESDYEPIKETYE